MTRLSYGILFAIPLGLVTSVWVQASGSEPEPTSECGSCHMAIHQAWVDSLHGQAVSDPKFVEAWMAQGESPECLQCHTTGFDSATGTWEEDGISCAACHSPYVQGHPLKAMPTNRSADLCASCHMETAFEWQVSPHAVDEMTCVTCHGQHSTNIKAGNASALCITCHIEVAGNFAHDQHLEEGLSCASCHLGEAHTEMGEGKSSRNHTFAVNLEACEGCHAYQAHEEGVIQFSPPEPRPEESQIEFESAGMVGSLQGEAGAVNPVVFALLAALVGMAAGMILAPWIERWYQKLGN
ncbi:MAG: multiheme c-type cytochrome [Anaerolineales bacterium]|nr:multiheme c-type cytochrome [Anaerolineales bacterium]